MEFREISEKEFDKFSSMHEQTSFSQTSSWGNLKKVNGWNSHFVALLDNKKIIGATLLLSKKVPLIKKNMCYAPRGFLIDYSNNEVLNEFTNSIKQYAKKLNAIFIKIDPYVSYQERNLDGDIVEDGKNNKEAFQNLINNGYKHFGFNLMQDTLQPRWIFVTDTKGKTIDDIMNGMDSKTRQIIRKNERECIRTREISYEELDKFKDIMRHTGDRRNFIDRPLSYYQNMYKNLNPKGILKILVAELNTNELITKLNEEKESYKKEYDERKYKHDEGINKMNEKKYESKQKETENNINRIEKRLKEIEDLKRENGDEILLGGILFLIHGKEVVSLVGGSYQKFMEFQSAYTVHFEGVKYAIEHGYDRYNFYGITGDFTKNNPLFGLYLFKRGFGGNVVELLGEFDLVISKFWYFIYKLSFKCYHKIKNIKN